MVIRVGCTSLTVLHEFVICIHTTAQEHAITSDEALSLDDLPEHNHTVVTVGAGYISLEFAHIFHGFGCETHVMYRKAAPLRG